LEFSPEFWQAVGIVIASILGSIGIGGSGVFVAFKRQTVKRQSEIHAAAKRVDAQAMTIEGLLDDGKKKDSQIAELKTEQDKLRIQIQEQSTLIDMYKSQSEKLDKHLENAKEDVQRERTRAGTAESKVIELRAKIEALDEREDKAQNKIIDISTELKTKAVDCERKDGTIDKLNARIAELESRPPPTPPDKVAGTIGAGKQADDDDSEELAEAV